MKRLWCTQGHLRRVYRDGLCRRCHTLRAIAILQHPSGWGR